MEPDDKVCYCYGVPLRKLWNYARRERPARASQLSECLGAGTGCGWCIPFLKRIHEAAMTAEASGTLQDISPEEYAASRRSYIHNREPRNEF